MRADAGRQRAGRADGGEPAGSRRPSHQRGGAGAAPANAGATKVEAHAAAAAPPRSPPGAETATADAAGTAPRAEAEHGGVATQAAAGTSGRVPPSSATSAERTGVHPGGVAAPAQAVRDAAGVGGGRRVDEAIPATGTTLPAAADTLAMATQAEAVATGAAVPAEAAVRRVPAEAGSCLTGEPASAPACMGAHGRTETVASTTDQPGASDGYAAGKPAEASAHGTSTHADVSGADGPTAADANGPSAECRGASEAATQGAVPAARLVVQPPPDSAAARRCPTYPLWQQFQEVVGKGLPPLVLREELRAILKAARQVLANLPRVGRLTRGAEEPTAARSKALLAQLADHMRACSRRRSGAAEAPAEAGDGGGDAHAGAQGANMSPLGPRPDDHGGALRHTADTDAAPADLGGVGSEERGVDAAGDGEVARGGAARGRGTKRRASAPVERPRRRASASAAGSGSVEGGERKKRTRR